MRVSARADYAVRALVELAAAGDVLLRAEDVAARQSIPLRFLQGILRDLRAAGLVRSTPGPGGGSRLARPADAVTLADVLRAVDGPLSAVHAQRPEELDPPGVAAPLREVWTAVRASLREVLEGVTLADVVTGTLPDAVTSRTSSPEAWLPR